MEEERERFHLTFWFCVGLVVIGIIAILAIIFLEVPKQNEQLANVAFGFFSGSLVTSAVQFLLGGTPTVAKKPSPTATGTSSATISAEITTKEDDETNNQK